MYMDITLWINFTTLLWISVLHWITMLSSYRFFLISCNKGLNKKILFQPKEGYFSNLSFYQMKVASTFIILSHVLLNIALWFVLNIWLITTFSSIILHKTTYILFFLKQTPKQNFAKFKTIIPVLTVVHLQLNIYILVFVRLLLNRAVVDD